MGVLLSMICRTLQRSEKGLIPTEINVQDFTGVLTRTKGILPVELRVGMRTSLIAFFVVKTSTLYNTLLCCDWMHPNFCTPYTLHQFLIFWNGEEVEVIGADNKPFVARVSNAEA